MLLKMINGGILDIHSNSDYIKGCETCDYGSCYTSCFDIELTNMKIHIESSQMYKYPLSEGHMMKVILQNVNAIQNMTEKEFSNWLKENLQREINCNLKYLVS